MDPVAAGPEWDAPEAEAGASRSSSERNSPGGTVEQAKEACLRLLAVRARSRAELAQRLAAKGYSPEVSDRALERLTHVGLVDDAAFAEQWVHSRHTFSGKGKQALAQELRRKGVPQQDVVSALAAITADDEESRAAELVRRKCVRCRETWTTTRRFVVSSACSPAAATASPRLTAWSSRHWPITAQTAISSTPSTESRCGEPTPR